MAKKTEPKPVDSKVTVTWVCKRRIIARCDECGTNVKGHFHIEVKEGRGFGLKKMSFDVCPECSDKYFNRFNCSRPEITSDES